MKNILIVGDYSSLGVNLKKGFSKLGENVVLFTNGDSWKKLGTLSKKDIFIKYPSNLKILNYQLRGTGKLIYLLKYFLYIKSKLKILEYDFIIIMNQEFISLDIKKSPCNTNYLPLKFLKKILKNNGKIYLLGCGDDSYYLKAENKYKYFPYKQDELLKLAFSKTESKIELDKILDKINGIIPTCWDYAEAYRLFYKNKEKIKETIQFPIDISEIEYTPNIIKDKIIIFHGLNREEFKGTKYIKEAMENIKRKYPDKVEIIIDGKMPLEEYKQVLKKSNIVIDQCQSYSYAMNAIISMAQGKLVFSGNEKECTEELNRENIPIVNITPSVKEIEEKLEYFIKNPHLISEMGEKSRKFIEEFHECSIVAKKYLQIMQD